MTLKKRVLSLLVLVVIFCSIGICIFAGIRIYNVAIQVEDYIESSQKVHNPDRGFYYQCGLKLGEMPQNVEEKIDAYFWQDNDLVLEMVQVNLGEYRDAELTSNALEQLDRLFLALSNRGKRYILRFVYDWDGEISKYEPSNLDLILRHIEQIGPTIRKYNELIYLQQGLFVGNWGEMNGTPFVDTNSLQQLSKKLLLAAENEAFLSVRMPMYWRKISGISEITDEAAKLNSGAFHIGLYNDGMLGSESDWGTYGVGESRKANPYTYWNREEELAFQDELCKYVPNGGETMCDNPYNDFENAIRDLRTMHVSYLNADYDRTVLEKWERSVYSGEDCYDGMNGLDYIERHLGYRFYIDSPHVEYSFIQNKMTLGANLKNSGFAPVYSEKEVYLTLKNAEQTMTMKCPQDLRRLTGGNQSEESVFFGVSVPVSELNGTEYEIYMYIWDPVNQQRILLANEQEPGEDGYFLGTVSFAHAAGYETIRELFQN